MKLPKRASSFLCHDEALAATEYAVMTSAILGGVIVAMTMFGDAVQTMYVAVTAAL